MGRAPLDGKLVVTPHGGYDFTRRSPADGHCGDLNRYPCTHWGYDLAAPGGTPVRAPHAGWLLVSAETNQAPFSGYGPAVVLLAHDDGDEDAFGMYTEAYDADTGTGSLHVHQGGLVNAASQVMSWRYTLLAHLDPASLTYKQGLIDATEDESHYYRGTPDGTWGLVEPGLEVGPRVEEGETLGKVLAQVGHVHWEVRKGPYLTGGEGGTVDPIKDWLKLYNPLVNPPVVSTSSGIPWWMLLLLLYGLKGRRR